MGSAERGVITKINGPMNKGLLRSEAGRIYGFSLEQVLDGARLRKRQQVEFERIELINRRSYYPRAVRIRAL